MSDMRRDAQIAQREEAAARKEQERRQGISFTQLLGLMIKFGIAMQLIQAPGRAIQYYSEVRDTAKELQFEATKTATLVPGIMANRAIYQEQIWDIAGRSILGGDAKRNANLLAAVGTEFASSLENIPPIDEQTYKTSKGDVTLDREVSTLLYLIELSQRLAATGQESDPRLAKDYITRIAGPLQWRPDSAEFKRAMNVGLATIDFGDVRMGELSDWVGEMIGPFTAIWGRADLPTQQEQFLQASALYGTITKTLNPEESATAFRNMIKATVDPPEEVRKELIALKKFGERTGQDLDITFGAYTREGALPYFRKVQGILGAEGTLVDRYIASQEGQEQIARDAPFFGGDKGIAEERLRTSISQEYLNFMFGNIRGMRGFMAAMVDGGEQLERFEKSLRGLVDSIDIMTVRERMLLSTADIQESQGQAISEKINQTGYNVEIGTLESARRKREMQLIEMRSGGVNRWVQSVWARSLNPRNIGLLETQQYKPVSHSDATIARYALEQGVNPAEMYSYFMETFGSAPEYLGPGKKGFRNFMSAMAIHKPGEISRDIHGQDPDIFGGIGFPDQSYFLPKDKLINYNEQYFQSFATRKSILDNILTSPHEVMQEVMHPGLLSEFEAKTPSPLSRDVSIEKLHASEATANNIGNLIQGDININVTVDGDKDVGQQIAEETAKSLIDLLDTDSLNDEATLRSANRNVG